MGPAGARRRQGDRRDRHGGWPVLRQAACGLRRRSDPRGATGRGGDAAGGPVRREGLAALSPPEPGQGRLRLAPRRRGERTRPGPAAPRSRHRAGGRRRSDRYAGREQDRLPHQRFRRAWPLPRLARRRDRPAGAERRHVHDRRPGPRAALRRRPPDGLRLRGHRLHLVPRRTDLARPDGREPGGGGGHRRSHGGDGAEPGHPVRLLAHLRFAAAVSGHAGPAEVPRWLAGALRPARVASHLPHLWRPAGRRGPEIRQHRRPAPQLGRRGGDPAREGCRPRRRGADRPTTAGQGELGAHPHPA